MVKPQTRTLDSYNLTPTPAHLSYDNADTDQQHKKQKQRPRDLSLPDLLAYYTDERGYWIGPVNVENRPWIRWQSKMHLAYRLKLELAGHDLTGQCVLHRDDNPLNMNLSNLRIGSHAENMADMVAKGRNRSPRPRIKGAEAAAIMQMEALGIPVLQIAKQFGRSYGKLLAFIRRTKAKQALRDSQRNAQASLCFPESLTPA